MSRRPGRVPHRARSAAALAAAALLTVGGVGAVGAFGAAPAWAAPAVRTGPSTPAAPRDGGAGATLGAAADGLRAAGPAARAAAPASPVTVTLSRLEPAAPAGNANSVLRAAGRLRASAGVTVTDIQVQLRFGGSVGSRGELDEQLAQAAQPTPSLPELNTVAFKAVPGVLRPGDSASFDVTAASRLGELAGTGFSVHPFEVIVVGTVNGQQERVAQIGTYVVSAPTGVAAPTPLSLVVPITDRPRLGPDGVLLDDTLATATGHQGRLGKLLAAVSSVPPARSPVVLAVDPALLDALQVMTSPYRVAAAGSRTVTKPPSAAAKDFLAGLAAYRGEVVPLPYADGDLTALAHAGRTADVSRMIKAGRTGVAAVMTHATVDDAVAVPPGGVLDTTTLTLLARNGIRTVVLDESAMPRGTELTYTPTAVAAVPTPVGSRRALVGDAGLTHLVSAVPGAAVLPRAAEHVVLAETAMMTLDLPNSTRPAVVTLPRFWSPPGDWAQRIIGALASASWLKPTGDLSRVARGTPATADERHSLTYTARDRANELPVTLLRSVAQLRGGMQDFCSALLPTTAVTDAERTPGPGKEAAIASASASGCPNDQDRPGTAFANPLTKPLELALDRSESAAWRPDVGAAIGFVGAVQRAFDSWRGQVTVVTSRAVTLTSRTGRVPATLQNGLQYPITVKLRLSAVDRSRLRSAVETERTLPANGQKVQVEVQVAAEGAGTFPVDLTLLTPTGRQLSVGGPHQVLVRSTAYGVIATVITVSAVGVLLLAVVVRLVRRLRRAAASRRGARTAEGSRA